MKLLLFLLASVPFTVATASAQVAAATSFSDPLAVASVVRSGAPAPDPGAEPAATAAADPQRPISVFVHYKLQFYAGYTLTRFYELPGDIQTRNGFDVGAAYYPREGALALDGTLMATFGHELGSSSHFVFGGVGPRYRWSGVRGIEFWTHGLVGRAHYGPQTANGPQDAFGYEAGIGADALAHHQNIAFRLELDMVGSHFFGTYQYSPKLSIGVVYRF